MNPDAAEPTSGPELLAERLRAALEQIETSAEASEQARNLLRQATSRFMDEQSHAFRELREETSATLDAFREQLLVKLEDLAASHRVLSDRQREAEERFARDLEELRGSTENEDAPA